MFLPTTAKELKNLGWKNLDVIIVTGDTYIDSPFIGSAVIGKVLVNAGYRVGIIAQPDCHSDKDITRLGEPVLFWGVTSGSTDSMVANYTAVKKKRRQDDFTPGGINNKRPDRALIVYSNLIRQYFKNTRPIVLGGLEASLRRVSHYDYWDDRIRRPILFDAKADILVYGMGEKAVLELAGKLKKNADYKYIRGTCIIHKDADEWIKNGYLFLPSFEETAADKENFKKMFHTFYQNQDTLTAKGLIQNTGGRFLVHHPPSIDLTMQELDSIYDIVYEREVHPYYLNEGKVKAQETIRFSITTHRGCYGECSFCSIALHQGNKIVERSFDSILREAKYITKLPDFKGYILDVGGPTANMYGIECSKKLESGVCMDKSCLYPAICPSLKVSHRKQVELLKKIRSIPGIKKVFVASGIRYDMVLYDKEYGDIYLKELVEHHISGQLKIAPEHSVEHVLKRMRKTGKKELIEFKKKFDLFNIRADKKQFLTYYFIAAHPGCDMEDMRELKMFVSKELRIHPEQVQIFTPTPSTYSTLMYYLEKDPFSGEKLVVEKNDRKKGIQKEMITGCPD